MKNTARALGNFAPVRFATGVLGYDRPLWVSQQHRVLFTGWRAELLFGESEVLIAAKHLVDGRDVQLIEGGCVTYLHLLFDAHQIVSSEGVPTESYFCTAKDTATDDPQSAEILALFPDMAQQAAVDHGRTARPVLRGYEASLLAA